MQTDDSSIAGVQYLRGIAAIMVVAVHAGNVLPAVVPWTAFGTTGVDIFFVISGFIMAHSTRSFDPLKPRGQQCLDFLRRRFIRVVPLYWIALLWTLKVPLAAGNLKIEYLQDFLFIPRIHTSGNIWPELIAGWTVNYEMFFYALFGAAMLAGHARYFFLSTVLCLFIAVGLLLEPTGVLAQFYTAPIIAEFLFGVVLYRVAHTIEVSRSLALALLCVSAVALIQHNGSLPRVIADGLPAIGVVWSTCQISRGTNSKSLRLLGDSSYSLYLFHLAVLSLMDRAHQAGYLPLAAMPSWVALCVLVISAAAVGLLVHLVVERPLLRSIRGVVDRLSSGDAWATARFTDTLRRWKMKPGVVNVEKKDIQPKNQTRDSQADH